MKANYLLLLLCLIWQPNFSQSGKVIGVSDGDTMEMLIEGKTYKIRLAHIDAPEKKQAFGTKAKQYLSDLCYGKSATMTVTDVDRYGRNVSVITLQDGTNVNQQMVKAGFAWCITSTQAIKAMKNWRKKQGKRKEGFGWIRIQLSHGSGEIHQKRLDAGNNSKRYKV